MKNYMAELKLCKLPNGITVQANAEYVFWGRILLKMMTRASMLTSLVQSMM